jgi:mycothiol synthase
MGGPVGHFSGTLPRVDLPAGLSTRPLQREDTHAVFEVIAAQEAADLDEVLIEEADIVGDWSRSSFDIAGSTIGVLVDSFAAGTAHGAQKSELSTDSRTGALALYEKSAWWSRPTGSTAD